MKKKIFILPILLLVVLVLSAFSPAGTLHQLTGIKDPADAKNISSKIYAETPFVRDMDKEIKMHSAASLEESIQLSEKVYAETPFIKNASAGRGIDVSSFESRAVPLPYYFNFNFDSNLISSTITNNNSGTVRITANGDWVQKPNDFEGTIYDNYDITLYAGGVSQGTYRFDTGGWQHADWTNVPTGDMYFIMSKDPTTWTGAPRPGYDGNISGSGEILNP